SPRSDELNAYRQSQTLRHFAGPGITFEYMKIARACAANCFFAFMLFNAAASGLAQEPGRSIKPASEIRADNNPKMETKKIGLAIHGGAGTIERTEITPEK